MRQNDHKDAALCGKRVRMAVLQPFAPLGNSARCLLDSPWSARGLVTDFNKTLLYAMFFCCLMLKKVIFRAKTNYCLTWAGGGLSQNSAICDVSCPLLQKDDFYSVS